MAEQQLSRTNVPSLLSLGSSSLSNQRGGKKFFRSSLEEMKKIYENAAKTFEIDPKQIGFTLWEIMDGKFLTVLKNKNSSTRDIAKIVDKNGNVLAEDVVHERTGYYFAPGEDWKKIINDFLRVVQNKVHTYLVDATKSNIEVVQIIESQRKAVTKITEKLGEKREIMSITGKDIDYINEIPGIVKKFEKSNVNEIRKLLKSSEEDFLWYVFIVEEDRGGNKKYLKYFKISSYQKRWKDYSKKVLNPPKQNRNEEGYIQNISHYYKTFLTDLDHMKEYPNLKSIIEKNDQNLSNLPENFRKFIVFVNHFFDDQKERTNLTLFGKALHYICEISRESELSTATANENSIIDVETFLNSDSPYRKYKFMAKNYKRNGNKGLLEAALEEVAKQPLITEKPILQLEFSSQSK
jgi:TusA-related sulfurtransferase